MSTQKNCPQCNTPRRMTPLARYCGVCRYEYKNTESDTPLESSEQHVPHASSASPLTKIWRSIGFMSQLGVTFLSVIAITLVVLNTDVEEPSGYKIVPRPPFICPVFPEITAYFFQGQAIYLAFQDSSDCGDIARLPRDKNNQEYKFTVSDVSLVYNTTTITTTVRCYSNGSPNNIIDLDYMPKIEAGKYGLEGETNGSVWGNCAIYNTSKSVKPKNIILRIKSHSNVTRVYNIQTSTLEDLPEGTKLTNRIWVRLTSR